MPGLPLPPGVGYGLAGLAILAVVVASALCLGDQRLRRAVSVAGLGWAGSLMVLLAGQRLDPVLSFALIHSFCLLLLIGLAWRPGAAWPVVAVMCQGLAVATDGVRLISPAMHRWAYLTALAIAGYSLLAAIAVGTVTQVRARHIRRPTEA